MYFVFLKLYFLLSCQLQIKFCLRQTLKNCLEKRAEDSNCLDKEVITLSDPQAQNDLSQGKEARDGLKITVKLLITKSDEEEITEALDKGEDSRVLQSRALARISELDVQKYSFGVNWVSKNTHLA